MMNKKFIPVIMGAIFTGYTLNSYAQVNKQLSNLSPKIAINHSLVPRTDNFVDLGSNDKGWKRLYLHDGLYLSGVLTIHATGENNYFNGPGAGNTAVTDFGGNTATGTNALHYLTSGYENTANGAYALYSNTTGIGNTATGIRTLFSNTTGTGNTANGFFALFSNTRGLENTANGDFTLYSNTSGNYNTANGYEALENNTRGNRNTAVGVAAGYAVTTGSRNTFIGYNANSRSGSLSNATAVGSGALVNASNQVRVGNNSVTSIGGYVGWTCISDGRVKRNIKSNVPGLAFINKLTPVTYNLDLDAADKIIQPQPVVNKTTDNKMVAPDQQQEEPDVTVRKEKEQVVYTGFVAQEVEKAAKELNYDFSGVDAAKNDKDLYGLRYAEFVVPLVKAVQELSKMNEELQARIEKLEAMVSAQQPGTVTSQEQAIKLSAASLEQNAPNPFNGISAINYTLPDAKSPAKIIVTDKSGRVLKEINVSGNIKGSIQIDASNLSAGTYQYSLYVNQQLIGSRQMVVSK